MKLSVSSIFLSSAAISLSKMATMAGSAPCKGFGAAGWGCGWRLCLGYLHGTGPGP